MTTLEEWLADVAVPLKAQGGGSLGPMTAITRAHGDFGDLPRLL